MTPEQIASKSEHSQQAAFFCWASKPEQRAQFPELEWAFAIPNGGERNKAVAGKLKAEGVKAGVLDIMIPVPTWIDIFTDEFPQVLFHGMFIEMKVGRNKPTKEQTAFMKAMGEAGYYCCVCYSWVEAKEAVIRYLTKGVVDPM